MGKLHINEVIVVEGKYDAAKLSNLVDTLIITTDGFSVFSKNETRELIKKLGRERGLIVLTDSDAAGFKIRNYINNFAHGVVIKNAYVPAMKGKEGRKPHSSKEGLLGVEGISSEIILQAIKNAGATENHLRDKNAISFTDLFTLGISGATDCASKRANFLKRLGLPNRLSKKALCEVLSALYSFEELQKMCTPRELVLFWDFHGTLVLPDPIWYDAAITALKSANALHGIKREKMREEFYNSKLPWWVEDKSGISLVGKDWWDFTNNELFNIYIRCGIDEADAIKATKFFKSIIMDKKTHRLHDDAIFVLEELSKKGYSQYLLSSNFPELKQITDDLNISHYFESIISSADIGIDKPSRQFYEYGLKIANSCPEKSLMIGDSVANDIEPALALGMQAIAVDRAFGCTKATWNCKSIKDILNVLT